jgi:hypothetical protein
MIQDLTPDLPVSATKHNSPVSFSLGSGGLCIGVITRTPGSSKHLGFQHFAGIGIHDRNRRPTVINEEPDAVIPHVRICVGAAR